MNSLKNFTSICIKCGACNTSCPTFLAVGGEGFSPRGRLAIIEELAAGNLKLSPRLKEIIFTCILCNSCTANCAHEVSHEKAIVAARDAIIRQEGIKPFERFIGHNINWLYPFLEIGLKTLGVGQNIINFNKKYFKFSKYFIPKISVRPLISRYQTIVKANNPPNPHLVNGGGEKARILFYTGCLINYVYPEIGESLINFFIKNNVTVILPKNQKCCGIPAYASGFLKPSLDLIYANLYSFEEHKKKYNYDYIVTACASCGAALKGFHADDRPEFKDAYGEISNKTIDFSEFIVKHLSYSSASELTSKVTYHSPCHLHNVQKVKESPVSLINSIFKNFISMTDYDQCCGFGGTFSLKNPQLSNLITEKKLENIKNTEAETILVNCPGCLMHLETSCLKNNLPFKIKHLASILEEV